MRHTRRNPPRFHTLLLALALLVPSFAAAQTPRRAAPPQQQRATPVAQSKRARLVLLIAVDQFRYDYLERFGDLFVAGGLRRLLRDGASWTNANYDHTPTETAPGHATMMTGAWPSETGIIANEWFDRDVGRRVLNASDDSVRLLGGGEKEAASSPRRLLVSTLGDELRLLTSGRSKVVGVSLKDRSAILPSGRHASAAYWFSPQTGRMVSSSYYFNDVPAWVTRFNETWRADRYFGQRWERALCEDKRPRCEEEYARRAGPDDAPWERGVGAPAHITFPHTVNRGSPDAPYETLSPTPFANDLVLAFAKDAMTNERLGADEDTDVLTVSFSANDYVGHRFGPYSQEVMDVTLRTDRQIADLLNFVERTVGFQHTLVAFTADHGVGPVPEHAASLNLPGQRVNPEHVETAIKNALRARFGHDGRKTDDYFLHYTPRNGNVYFNPVALARDGVAVEDVQRLAGQAALTVPGISRYFTRAQLVEGSVSPADAIARRVLHGYHARRGGDLVLVTQPYHYVSTYTGDHFSPYSYDTHVPVILMGERVAPGTYTQPATPADIAPTLAAILRVQAPSNSMGRVLVEALKE
ncbi:MAG TPA: alkaline phosphatase family protein [Pyrinomonadaceae bacterium]|nr:alkaline phosphatase family protein [Pyrinomonadaceae bacterium]